MISAARNPTQFERDLTAALIERAPQFQGRLIEQLHVCSIRKVNQDGTILEFLIPGHVRPKSKGRNPWPIEGLFTDADGIKVHVYLFIDALHFLYELEFCKEDGSLIKQYPSQVLEVRFEEN